MLAGREARRADLLVMWWSAVFWLLTWVLFFVSIAMDRAQEPTLSLASRVIITLVFVGIPGIISAVLAGRAWRSWKPTVALLLATTVICIPELFFDFGIWFLAAPVVWNAAYAAGCVGPIIELRKHPSLARETQCLSCGYRYQRGGSLSFCPECGVTRITPVP